MPKIATGNAIDTNNGVVVVAVTFFFSVVAEIGAGVVVGTGIFVAEIEFRDSNALVKVRKQ